MNDSVKIDPHGGAFGLYRLLFWHKTQCCYVFPEFSEFLALRVGVLFLRPHSLNMCRLLRDDLLSRFPAESIIITPYPI